jgi:hypothetical protein
MGSGRMGVGRMGYGRLGNLEARAGEETLGGAEESRRRGDGQRAEDGDVGEGGCHRPSLQCHPPPPPPPPTDTQHPLTLARGAAARAQVPCAPVGLDEPLARLVGCSHGPRRPQGDARPRPPTHPPHPTPLLRRYAAPPPTRASSNSRRRPNPPPPHHPAPAPASTHRSREKATRLGNAFSAWRMGHAGAEAVVLRRQ